MTISNGPPAKDDVSDPSHHVLFEELGTVRKRGVGNPDKPLLDLAGLLYVARLVSDEDDDERKVENALWRATERLGGIGTDAMRALLGLTIETRGRDVKYRREKAAKAFDHKDYEGFRTGAERQLLFAVSTSLIILLAEKRIADREYRLRYRDSEPSILPLISTLLTEDTPQEEPPSTSVFFGEYFPPDSTPRYKTSSRPAIRRKTRSTVKRRSTRPVRSHRSREPLWERYYIRAILIVAGLGFTGVAIIETLKSVISSVF